MPSKTSSNSQDARWEGGTRARQGPPGREFSRLCWTAKKVAAEPPSPSPGQPRPAPPSVGKKGVTKCTKKFLLQHTNELLSWSTAEGEGEAGQGARCHR